MNLAERQISDFCRLLASDAPAPGGGAAAGLSGALGAGLAGMVCSLTVGKEKYAAHQALAKESGDKLEQLRAGFFRGMDWDAEAFYAVSQAYKLPRNTPEEQRDRMAEIQKGLQGCTQPPFEMMKLAVEGLECTRALLGRSNRTAVSDLGVGALHLKTALQSSWLNVIINIGSMEDKELAAYYRQEGEALLQRGISLADQIYETVLTML